MQRVEGGNLQPLQGREGEVYPPGQESETHNRVQHAVLAAAVQTDTSYCKLTAVCHASVLQVSCNMQLHV